MVEETEICHRNGGLDGGGVLSNDVSGGAMKNKHSLPSPPAVFFTDEDCHCDRHWPEETARACDCAVHADAPMTNYAHLLLTPAESEVPSRLTPSPGRHYVLRPVGNSAQLRQAWAAEYAHRSRDFAAAGDRATGFWIRRSLQWKGRLSGKWKCL